MKTDTSSVIDKMSTMEDNPLDFDDLIGAWNSLYDQSWSNQPDDFQFAEIENAAMLALSDSSNRQRTGYIGNEISRMLSTFDYPTFMVTSDGRVAAINTAASIEFDLDIGDKIDHLPYSLDAGQKVSALVRRNMQNNQTGPIEPILKRAIGKVDEREATIAVTTSLGRVATALVFVITTKWKPDSAELLKRQFGLTETEAEILISFVDGYSTQDIAAQRHRSHTTVRTQLQSILTKTGARNQTELLRISLSVSDFVKNIGVIADAVNHPHRRQAEILRAGGRLVEITLTGNPGGDPIVAIAEASHYTFNAEFEQHLYDANLCIMSVCPPSFGRTDVVSEDLSRVEQISEDVIAILDQLGVQRCPVLAMFTTAPIAYALANTQPHRISHVVHLSTIGPIKYAGSDDTVSPWVTGMIRACRTQSAMGKIVVRGAVKAWVTLGARQFMRFQLTSNSVDAECVLRPENLKEYEHALTSASQRGLSPIVEDIELAFGDWTADMEAAPQNTTIIHGKQDMLFTIESVRKIAATFAHKTTLFEVADAGYAVIHSHPEQAVAVLRSVVDAECARLSNDE